MGFWGRQWRRTKNFTTENAGKLARAGAVAGAGIGATVACFGNPVCGIAAAAVTDAALGGAIERNTQKALDKGASAAENWLADPQGPPPPGMLHTRPVGAASRITSIGEARRFADSDPVGEAERRRRRRDFATGVLILGSLTAAIAYVAKQRFGGS